MLKPYAAILLLIGCAKPIDISWTDDLICEDCHYECRMIEDPPPSVTHEICWYSSPEESFASEQFVAHDDEKTFVASSSFRNPEEANVFAETSWGLPVPPSEDDFENEMFERLLTYLRTVGKTRLKFEPPLYGTGARPDEFRDALPQTRPAA